MQIHEVAKVVNDLLKKHNLYDQGWRFRVNRRKCHLGLCDYRKKEVQVSKYHIELGTREEIMDTILHEIAHAITPNDMHGPLWKAAAQSLGANPSRCKEVLSYTMPSKYKIWCSGCNRVIYSMQRKWKAERLQYKYCAKCGRRTMGQLQQIES